MDMIGKVRRMKLRDQLSDEEICRRKGLARNTVKKWLKAPSDITPKYQRKKANGKLTLLSPCWSKRCARMRKRSRPRALVATGPDQIYCWDISYLPTEVCSTPRFIAVSPSPRWHQQRR